MGLELIEQAGGTLVISENPVTDVIEIDNQTSVIEIVEDTSAPIVIEVFGGPPGADGAPGASGATNLDGLSDAVITTPTTAQILRYNGTNWVNATGAKGDVGLGNVDNTSDAAKPLSTAANAAFLIRPPQGLPEIVGSRTTPYNTNANLYGTKAQISSLRAAITTLSAQAATSVVPILLAGDSFTSGWGATSGSTDYAAELEKALVAAGIPVTGGWVFPGNGNTPADSRWTFGGTNSWQGRTTTTNNYVWSSATGNTATFTSTNVGTTLEFALFAGSALTVNYNLDSGAQTGTFTLTANQIASKKIFTGLANTTHTVTITTTSATTIWLAGASVHGANGVAITNAGIYGSHTEDWLPTALTSAAYNPYNLAQALAGTPKLTYLCLGGNNAIHTGHTLSAMQSDLVTIGNAYVATGSAVLMRVYPYLTATGTALVSANNPTTPNWSQYVSAIYSAADSVGVPLVDHSWILGDPATRLARGLGISDNLHLAAPGQAEIARHDFDVTFGTVKAGLGLSNVDNTSDASKTFAASQITSGVINTARLGTGTANSTTYLRGDGTWATVTGGATALSGLSDVSITSLATANFLRYNGTAWANYAITSADVGLGNVNNTSDATKFTNPSFTGTTVTLADAENIVVGTTTGTKIGTATTQKLGFFNATPVTQQGAGLDLGSVLSNLGLRASGATFADRVGNALITATTTLTTTSPSHNYVNSATATYNIGLPATTTAGYKFTFIKTDATAFPVTITGTFNSGTNYVLTNQWDNVTVMSTSVSGTYVVISSNRADQITGGIVPTARLGSGTANSTTYLRGDSTFATLDKTAVGLANVPNVDTSNAANISSGTLAIARLGASGTPSSTTFLRGDNVWATPAGGGGGTTLAALTDVTLTSPVSSNFLRYNGTAWVNYVLTKSDVALGNVVNLDTSNASNITTGTLPIGQVPTGTTGTTVALGNHTHSIYALIASPSFTGTTFTLADAQDIVVGSTTGTKIGTATTQKIGFFGSTAVVQQAATTDLGTTLSNLGLRAAGTAYPITTSGAVSLTGSVALPAGTTGLTKTTIGLANVDNTADTAKPVSTAQQTALNLKADLASPTFTGTVSGITKTMVGLSNVDNTSDVTKNAAAVALTNKTIGNTNTLTIKDTLFTLQDDGDATKLLAFQLSGITTATTRTLTVPNASGTIALFTDITAANVGLGSVVNVDSTNADALTSGTVSIDRSVSGTTLTVYKSGTWPARPTARTDVTVFWVGADPSPTIITSAGTGGMLDNVDIRIVV